MTDFDVDMNALSLKTGGWDGLERAAEEEDAAADEILVLGHAIDRLSETEDGKLLLSFLRRQTIDRPALPLDLGGYPAAEVGVQLAFREGQNSVVARILELARMAREEVKHGR